MKKLSFFLMAMLMSVMSFAQVVTFSPANETAVESQTFTLTSGDVTLVCSSGTITADQFRFFKNQTVTISSTGGNIVSVEFTCTASDGAKYGPGCFTTTSGDYTYAGKVGTWTGEANEVKFTASSNQVRATQVVVTLLAAGGVPQPSIQGATDFIESAEVSIVASEGLKVYYTLDGTDPTTESTEYTAPFTVEETTTVKAIAHDGTNASDVTETTFTKATKVTCAEAAEIASQLSGNNVLSDLYYVVVGYVTELDGTISNGQQKFWVSDTKGGANTLYSYWCNVPQELVVGDYIQMFGKLTKYYEKNQMKNGDVTILEEPTPEPVKYTVTVTAENGTVEGAGEYEEGTEITLTATANEGYEFVNWTSSETVVSTENPYTFTVTADIALVANFELIPPTKYTVTVTAENGTVTGAGEYEEGKEATLTATANEGYEFTCWTSGEDTVSTANPYTFAVTANVALVANFKEVVVEPTTETVYFIDVKKWGKVNAYAWNAGGNNGWPGKAATKEAEQIAGFDVYSFTANAGQYDNVIFNNKVGDTGSQTDDLVWTAGKYYWMGVAKNFAGATKEEAEATLAAPLPDAWNIVGDAGLMGKGWDLNAAENAMTKQEDGTYKLEKKDITITAGSYEYKAAKDHDWAVAVPQSGNQKLTISKSGIYDVTFVLDVTAKKLTATATLKKEAVVIPDVIIAGDMNSWNQTKDKFTMSADSLTATFKATLAVKNYGFKMIVGGAWHSDGKTITRAANSTKFTGANSNTNSTLKADIAGEYLFTWEYATKTLTVTYPELPVEYTVTATVNPAETGTVAGAGKYEEGKTATLTATPAEGYEFVNWTVAGEEVSTEATYSFAVTADVALVANFKEAEPVYQVIEDEITNFVFDTESWPMVCSGGPSANYQIEVFLVLTEAADGTLSYEDCSVSINGTDATFIDGTLSDLDVYAPSADAVLRVQWNGEFYELHLAMSAAAAEPIVVVVENATLDDKVESTGFFYMAGECTIDGVIYPVKAEIPGFDKTKAEAEYENVMVEVGTWGGEYLGNATGTATVSVVDNVVTLSGVIENPMTHVAFDVTISGTLPVVEPTTITWELNGGEFPAVVVPTNAELWEAFKPYYNTYYGLERADQPITAVASFASAKMQEIMTDPESEYKWLGDYVLSVAAEQGVTVDSELTWRFSVHTFFNAEKRTAYPSNVPDFTEAGKPENWGPAYQAAHEVVLPTEPVAEDYVLPTPVKEGYTFVGWYDNADGEGEAMTVLPAGWAGTLYAIWKVEGPATALENIAVEGKAVKAIVNGQLIIIKNGVQYNAQGQVVK